MGAQHILRLFSPDDGGQVADLDDFERVTIRRRVNGVESYELQLKGSNKDIPYFVLDAMLEDWRRDAANGIDWYREFCGFHRTPKGNRRAGVLVFTSSGVGLNDLLQRRCILYPAESAYAKKSGKAETVAKSYVKQNLGSDATSPPRFADGRVTGFTVQADGATGNTWENDRAGDNLLKVCQDIAQAGGGDFAVVRIADLGWEFRWYNGQLGTDRRNDVIFSTEMGTLEEPEYEFDRIAEINVVCVLGPGDASARTPRFVQDASLVDDSPLNRREYVVDAKNETATAGQDAKGASELAAKKPRPRLRFAVRQTSTCLYGKDYFLGDIVTVRYAEMGIVYEAAQKIVGVQLDVVRNQDEAISLETESL